MPFLNPISTPLDSRIKPIARDTVVLPPTNPNGPNYDSGAISVSPAVQRYETNLQLPPDREQFLVDWTMQRINEVCKEMGRLDGGRVKDGSFLGVRMENLDTYEGNLEWRKRLGGIFPSSNFSLGDNKRYVRVLSARIRDDLLGTKPYFGAMTTDEGDIQLTHDTESYVQERTDASNIGETLREAIRTALIVNEAVIKTTYVKETTTFFGPATVLIDNRGMPVRLKSGEYIYQYDDFIDDPSVQQMSRLAKDPSFTLIKGTGMYARFNRIEQTLVHYDNAKAEVLNTCDFLCPLKVKTTWDADINVHLYEASPGKLREMYPNINVSDRYFMRRRGAQTGAMQPKRQSGEDDEQAQSVELLLIAECYIRCDADNDGREEEIMLVLDLTNGEPVFYDYLGNHMSRRPFSVIPGVEKVPGRWHAIGVFSKMRGRELYTDAQFNRINEKDSQNAAITYYHKDASDQWRGGEPFSPGSRKAIEIRANWDPKIPIAGRINLQADATLGLDMLNLNRQGGDLEFAVLSGRDASASNLNQSNTATGVMSVERDANLVSKDNEVDIAGAIENQLWLTVEILLTNMRPQELMFRDGGKTLITLNREEIRALPRKVKLLLTKSRSAEMLATSEKAEAIWMRYMRLSPLEQFYGRPFYIKQLKGLEVDDADDYLPKVTQEQVQQWQQQQAQGPTKDPSTSIAIKYSDLLRSEQVQELQKYGITPGSPDEMAQKLAGEVQLKALEKGNAAPAPNVFPARTPEPGAAGGLGAAA